jgi:hypothetical protein
MVFILRREPRQNVDRPAWISTGDNLPLRACRLVDISQSGAKLRLEDVDDMPDTFSLWLTRRGQPRYWCRIVWSSDKSVGVQFETPPASPDKTLSTRA